MFFKCIHILQKQPQTDTPGSKNSLELFKELGANEKGSNSELNIRKDDKFVQKESELTELFNSYFVNVATNLKEAIIPSDFETLITFVTSKVPTQV